MTKRVRKSSDGLYYINGQAYSMLVGSRAQVYHRTAFKTPGGLKLADLYFNRKTGRIVSKKKHNTAKREKKLARLGYKPVRGKPFVPMRRKTRRQKR